MKKPTLKPLVAALGMALAAPAAMAVDLDFSGSNIYMKFLDGDQRRTSNSSGDTATGADVGQWTEFELRIKARISKQVEAGVRVQSRSPAAYWTDFGFANNEGFSGANPGDIRPQQSKFMKLRGAYVLLTPGYSWLDQALIGSSDWGQFDPFTVGQVRYIDRDNYNGLYFKGPLPNLGPVRSASWEFGRLSLPNYLQNNYGQGPACCGSDSSQFNEAVYIVQGKATVGPVKLATSYQEFNDRILSPADTNSLDGRDLATFGRNRVAMLKAEGTALNLVDLKGAYYLSGYRAPSVFDQPWINSPKSAIRDDAYKLDIGLNTLPISGLTVNFQYFNIGAGFYSNTAARRETDVLLTEGSEAAWHRWGSDLWAGGAAKDYQQAPSSAKCFGGATAGRCRGDSGLAGGANGLVDNDFMDFDEAPNESIQGWKGTTLLVGYEVAKTPLSLELTSIGYNYNWQNYSPTGPLSNFFALNNDRKTNIAVFKASHVLPVAGGLELGFKYKLVDDKNRGSLAVAADDRDTKDSGYTLSAGNQLFSDLYGSISFGSYNRKIVSGASTFDNKKDILSVRLSYNLAGFETGLLSQWVKGDGDPGETGTKSDIKQYRMKAFVKAIF
jgi:hypothetical protein